MAKKETTVTLDRAVFAELMRAAKYAAQQVSRERAVYTVVATTTAGSEGRKNAELAFKQKRELTDVAITDLWSAITAAQRSTNEILNQLPAGAAVGAIQS